MSLCKGDSSTTGPGTFAEISPRTPASIHTLWYLPSLNAAAFVTPLKNYMIRKM